MRIAMVIRIALSEDAPAIWSIMEPVIRAGETYTLDRDMTEEQAFAYWMGSDKETFVAEEDGIILGTYYMRPNQAGGGHHVRNCGFMVSAAATGHGIAGRMGKHALGHARSRGHHLGAASLSSAVDRGFTQPEWATATHQCPTQAL